MHKCGAYVKCGNSAFTTTKSANFVHKWFLYAILMLCEMVFRAKLPILIHLLLQARIFGYANFTIHIQIDQPSLHRKKVKRWMSDQNLNPNKISIDGLILTA